MFGWLIDCLVGRLVGWLVGWLIGWLVDRLVDWLVASRFELNAKPWNRSGGFGAKDTGYFECLLLFWFFKLANQPTKNRTVGWQAVLFVANKEKKERVRCDAEVIQHTTPLSQTLVGGRSRMMW